MVSYIFLGRTCGLGNRLEQVLICLCDVIENTEKIIYFVWPDNGSNMNRENRRLFEINHSRLIMSNTPPTNKHIGLPSLRNLISYKKEIVSKATTYIKFYGKIEFIEPNVCGIHIRRGDRIINNTSKVSDFTTRVDCDRILESMVKICLNRGGNIFVSSDDELVKNNFINRISQVCNVVLPIYEDIVSVDYLDLRALSICSEIYMVSKFSSYPIIASLIGDTTMYTFFDPGLSNAYRYNATIKVIKS